MRYDEVFDGEGNLVLRVAVPYTQDELHEHRRQKANALLATGTTYTHDTHGVFKVGALPNDISLIGGAILRALLDGDDTLEYEYSEPKGDGYLITNADFKSIGRAQSEYVQSVLDKKNAVKKKIDNGTITTPGEIDSEYEA